MHGFQTSKSMVLAYSPNFPSCGISSGQWESTNCYRLHYFFFGMHRIDWVLQTLHGTQERPLFPWYYHYMPAGFRGLWCAESFCQNSLQWSSSSFFLYLSFKKLFFICTLYFSLTFAWWLVVGEEEVYCQLLLYYIISKTLLSTAAPMSSFK